MSFRSGLALAVLALSTGSCAVHSREAGQIAVQAAGADIDGHYLFSSLEENCELSGSLGSLSRTGRHGHPLDIECDPNSKSRDFLPLPMAHWAHPGTTIAIEVQDNGLVLLRLYLRQAVAEQSPYDRFSLDSQFLREREDMMQIPVPASDWTALDWSMSRDEQGLRYELSRTKKGFFLVVPYRSRFEMTCLLPPASR